MDFKICNICFIKKSVDEFSIDNNQKDRRERRCKFCNNKRQRERRIYNPELVDEFNLKRRRKTRERLGLDINTPRLTSRAWKGKGYIDKKGYRVICRTGHPFAYTKNYKIHEHTFLMCCHLGRKLRKGESIHHKNGIRHDNRIENLELWDSSHPSGQRVSDKIEWCKEFLANHGLVVVEVKNDEPIQSGSNSP